MRWRQPMSSQEVCTFWVVTGADRLHGHYFPKEELANDTPVPAKPICFRSPALVGG
jgi:hypothetical protein